MKCCATHITVIQKATTIRATPIKLAPHKISKFLAIGHGQEKILPSCLS